MFDMILAFPASQPALEDLKVRPTSLDKSL